MFFANQVRKIQTKRIFQSNIGTDRDIIFKSFYLKHVRKTSLKRLKQKMKIDFVSNTCLKSIYHS